MWRPALRILNGLTVICLIHFLKARPKPSITPGCQFVDRRNGHIHKADENSRGKSILCIFDNEMIHTNCSHVTWQGAWKYCTTRAGGLLEANNSTKNFIEKKLYSFYACDQFWLNDRVCIMNEKHEFILPHGYPTTTVNITTIAGNNAESEKITNDTDKFVAQVDPSSNITTQFEVNNTATYNTETYNDQGWRTFFKSNLTAIVTAIVSFQSVVTLVTVVYFLHSQRKNRKEIIPGSDRSSEKDKQAEEKLIAGSDQEDSDKALSDDKESIKGSQTRK